MKPNWFSTTVKLGDLKPWDQNPRYSTKAQTKRLVASFDELGQVETIAIGPNGEVYNGHQRLSALLSVRGPEYEIDARQSDRELTDEERQKLVIYLHSGAVGSWDWDIIAGWNTQQVITWGMDKDALGTWKKDIAALGNMLESEEPVPEFKEYDESAAEEVEYLTCPHCGKTFPK